MDTSLILWLEENTALAIPVLIFFAFAEACVGIGLFTSGIILLGVATLIAANELATPLEIVIFAWLGAFFGDNVGFYFGRAVGPTLLGSNFFSRYKTGIQKAELLMNRFGWGAIFIGRFIPALRSLVPFLVGINGFSRIRYFFLDALACGLWAMALGAIVFGLNRFNFF
jgi:membrane-associated protein